MDNERLAGFPPRTIDKVERLLDLLEEMGEHPLLRGKLALHGGTAINLFMLGFFSEGRISRHRINRVLFIVPACF